MNELVVAAAAVVGASLATSFWLLSGRLRFRAPVEFGRWEPAPWRNGLGEPMGYGVRWSEPSIDGARRWDTVWLGDPDDPVAMDRCAWCAERHAARLNNRLAVADDRACVDFGRRV